MFEDGFSRFPRVAVGCPGGEPFADFRHTPNDAATNAERFWQLAQSIERPHGSHATREQPSE